MKSYNYRNFQYVWDATCTGRTPEACSRCRHRRAKCDGEHPCKRCQQKGLECVYIQPQLASRVPVILDKEEEEKYKMMEELSNQVTVLERALEGFKVEIQGCKGAQTIKEIVVFFNTYRGIPHANEERYVRNECKGQMTTTEVVQGKAKLESKSWIVIMTKKGIRLNVSNTQQLNDFLAFFASSSKIHCEPPAVFRPVGTQTMVLISIVRWPRWYAAHAFKFQESLQLFQSDQHADTSALFIEEEMEEILLDAILMQGASCSPSNHTKFSQWSPVYNHIQQLQSPQHRALRYAVGAMTAQHILGCHFDSAEMHALGRINTTILGHELAMRYFSKAKELLINQILESDESSSLCVETIGALTAMFTYLTSEQKFTLASAYIAMALRVATQLNYHKVLCDSKKTIIDVDELEKAIMWNFLVCTDQNFADFSQLARHSTFEYLHLNLANVAIRIPPDMPQDRLHRFHDQLFRARCSAICRDYLDYMWSDDAPAPTGDDLDRYVNAFARWYNDLPLNLHVPSQVPQVSRAAFLLAVDLQLSYHVSVLSLHQLFLPSVHPDPSFLQPELQRQAERAFSEHATMATRMMLTAVCAGGCVFPLNLCTLVCRAHMRLVSSEEHKIARRNRAYVARIARMLMNTTEYRMMQQFFRENVQSVHEFMLKEDIQADADLELGPEDDPFKPVKMAGTGW